MEPEPESEEPESEVPESEVPGSEAPTPEPDRDQPATDRAEGGPADGDAGPSLDRRSVLAATGTVAAGGLAGCGSGDGDGGDSTTDPTATTEAPTETTAAPTSSTPTTEAPTSTAEPTSTATTAAPELTEASDVLRAPSSELKPTDGFASADWLVEEDPRIMKVTTLEPDGPGSLNEALHTPEPRIIVFEVGGIIDMQGEPLQVKPVETSLGARDLSKVFIAGQTAPDPGITILRGEVSPYARDMILQHLRVRVGDDVGDAYDSISVGSLAHNCIVDHCSVSWSIDENLSTDGGADVGEMTFSNNIVAEALHDSIHPKGPHSMGSLINNNAPEVTVMGNIYSSNDQRHPRLKGGTTSAVVNNLIYEFNAGTVLGRHSEEPAQSSVVGNHYVDEAEDGEAVIRRHGDADMGQAYVEDNQVTPGGRPIAENIKLLDERPLWPEGLEALPVEDVQDHNHATAGATPARRTAHDVRILEDSRALEKEIIDSQTEVGGYPTHESTSHELDPPEYGPQFAEWLAQHTRAVELGEERP